MLASPEPTVRPGPDHSLAPGDLPLGHHGTRRHGGPRLPDASGAGRRPGLSGLPGSFASSCGRRPPSSSGQCSAPGSDSAWPVGAAPRCSPACWPGIRSGRWIPRLSGGCRLGPVRPAPVDEDLDAIAHRPVSFALHKTSRSWASRSRCSTPPYCWPNQSFAFTPSAILVRSPHRMPRSGSGSASSRSTAWRSSRSASTFAVR